MPRLLGQRRHRDTIRARPGRHASNSAMSAKRPMKNPSRISGSLAKIASVMHGLLVTMEFSIIRE